MYRRLLASLTASLLWIVPLPAQEATSRPAGPASAGSVASSANTDPPTAQQIEKWVSQLSADQFSVRDTATRNLIGAGGAAVKAVLRALDGSDLEVTARGIFVLQRLALVGDLPSEEAARAALEQLAAARVTAAARRATEALGTLQRLKQDQALKQLAGLGAVVDPAYEEAGLTATPVMAVEIGDQWRGQVSDLRRLKWLQNVELISLTGKQVTNGWVSHIREMRNLTTVKIGNAQVGRSAIEHLQALPRLRNVKLLYVPLGDEIVEPLKQCAMIENVQAYGTRLTAEGAAKLAATGMQVDRRQGAFLGISVSSTNEGADWFIDRVTANSAAMKAGLRSGDVIVRYDDRPVADFNSLRAMIADNNVGDKVTIHVRRDAQIFVKEITFGSWE